MGDGELYQFTGYSLTQGADPFSINPEVPPLGKYILGTSIGVFGNPYLINGLLLVVSLLAVWKISAFFPLPIFKRIILVLIFASTPLVYSQLFQSLLDLPQLTALLLHMLFMIKLFHSRSKKEQVINILFAGVSLGCVIAIKVGTIFPFIILADWYLMKKKKNTTFLFVIIGVSFLTYLCSYTQYFISGNTIFSWVKSQLWMMHFYLKSEVKTNPLILITSLFSGFYKGWWGEGWKRVFEWNLFWPFSIVSLVIAADRCRRKHMSITPELFYIVAISLGILLLFFLIPFWPRYFLLLLPFSLTLLLLVMSEKILFIVISISLIQSFSYVFPSVTNVAQVVQQRWNDTMFQEMHDELIFQPRDEEAFQSRTNFQHTMQKVVAEMYLKEMTIKVSADKCSVFVRSCGGKIQVTYQTPLGEIQHISTANFVKDHSQWKLLWDWGYVLPEFDGESDIVLDLDFVEGVYVETSDGIKVMEKKIRPFLSLIPAHYKDGENAVQDAALFTGEIKNIIRPTYIVEYQGLSRGVLVGAILPEYIQEVEKRIQQGDDYFQISFLPAHEVINEFKQFKLEQKLSAAAPLLKGIDTYHGGRLILHHKNGETKELISLQGSSEKLVTVPFTLKQIEKIFDQEQ